MAEMDLASLMLNKNTGVTGGQPGQQLRAQQPAGAYGAPAPAAPAPAPAPQGASAPIQAQAPPLQAAPAAPPPNGMSPEEWATFQARYHSDPAAMAAQRNTAVGQPAAAPGAAGQPGAPAADPNPLGTAFKQSLMARIQANAAPTSIADDPVLAAQSGAFRQAQAREEQRNRSAAMEQFGASGLESSGAASGAQRKLQQGRAFDEGQFDADLLGNARKDRMAELQGFLSIAGNTLSNEERNGLERELAQLDAAVKREGIASTAALGNADLRLREQLGMGGLNQNLLSILLNNRTDNDRTGLTAAGMGLNANTQALMALMNGGG